MSLIIAKLEKVKRRGDGTIRARCPACAAIGGDKGGNHLRIFPDGRFGCATSPGDGAHRREIFRIAGFRTPRTPVVMSIPPVERIKVIHKGILGRLGRPSQSLAHQLSEGENQKDTSVDDKKNHRLILKHPSEPSEIALPHLAEDGTLRIPLNSPRRFRWWQAGGAPLKVTARWVRRFGRGQNDHE